jgi:hypothetical protein
MFIFEGRKNKRGESIKMDGCVPGKRMFTPVTTKSLLRMKSLFDDPHEAYISLLNDRLYHCMFPVKQGNRKKIASKTSESGSTKQNL